MWNERDMLRLTKECELGPKGAVVLVVETSGPYMTARHDGGRLVRTGRDYAFAEKIGEAALSPTDKPRTEIRAGFWENSFSSVVGTYVVVESGTNRVTASGADPCTFDQVTVWHRASATDAWTEVATWDQEEWQTTGTKAFDAILGAIGEVAAGVEVKPKPAEF